MSFVRRYWVLILLVVAIVVLWIILSNRHTPIANSVQPAVEIVTARQGQLRIRVSAHGRVGPPPGSSASLAFVVSGRIQSIDVHVGQQVTLGEPLAQLDSEPFALAVDQARGDADAASGSLQSTAASVTMRNADAKTAVRQADLKVQADQRALQRVQALYAAGVAAAKDVQAQQSQLASDEADARAARVHWDALLSGAASAGYVAGNAGQAQADVMAARGQAERAQAALAQAQRELANSTLRAPSDGIVVAILRHPGESVDSTAPVVVLGAPEEHTATLSLAGELAARIHVGDDAEIRVARSSMSSKGKVVAVVSAVDPATQQATVVVSGLPPTAYAGDAVDASIVIGRAGGILVPTAAIVQDPQTGNTLVFVENQAAQDSEQRFAPRVVKVGASDSSMTQIVGGLKAGEKIAAQGAFELLAPANPSSD